MKASKVLLRLKADIEKALISPAAREVKTIRECVEEAGAEVRFLPENPDGPILDAEEVVHVFEAAEEKPVCGVMWIEPRFSDPAPSATVA